MESEKIMRYAKEKNSFANLVGINIIEVREGYSKVELFVSKEHLNPTGAVHGGCLYTLADMAGGVLAFSHGCIAPTLNSNIHYLNAGLNTSLLYAEAHEIKCGKRSMVYNVTVKDQDDVLLAEAIFTYMSTGTKVNLDELEKES